MFSKLSRFSMVLLGLISTGWTLVEARDTKIVNNTPYAIDVKLTFSTAKNKIVDLLTVMGSMLP
jgi:16S rRNA A1518/A1519 N6-dimethyltransferase RsmA/KsgA/DIM1 with predicted DNA glycosylase/AP lyase activity